MYRRSGYSAIGNGEQQRQGWWLRVFIGAAAALAIILGLTASGHHFTSSKIEQPLITNSDTVGSNVLVVEESTVTADIVTKSHDDETPEASTTGTKIATEANKQQAVTTPDVSEVKSETTTEIQDHSTPELPKEESQSAIESHDLQEGTTPNIQEAQLEVATVVKDQEEAATPSALEADAEISTELYDEKSSETSEEDSAILTKMYDLSLYAWNEYTEDLGPAAREYPWFDPEVFLDIVEPFKEHHFQACVIRQNEIPSREGCLSDELTVSWTVDGGDTMSLLGGATWSHEFKSIGEHNITIQVTVDGTDIKTSATVLCRYVRRELRDLTANDRGAFLDAAAVLWKIPTEQGREKYGDTYMSIADMTEFLSLKENDGLLYFDQIKKSAFYLNHLLGISMTMEAAMQSINPATSLAYWDYSKDLEAIASQQDFQGADFGKLTQESEIFTADWFGSVGKPSGDNNVDQAIVVDGRWGYTRIGRIAEESENSTSASPIIGNSYGYLRAPWNNNNLPYLTRSATMCGATTEKYQFDYWEYPTCSVMWSIESEEMSLSEFSHFVQSSLQTPMSALLGGSLECTDTFDRLEKQLDIDTTVVSRFRSVVFEGLKKMFYAGNLEMPDTCSLSVPFQDCGARCMNLEAYIERNDTAALENYLSLVDFLDLMHDYPLETRVDALRLICDGGFSMQSDHLDVSSFLDISNYPMQATVDRLLQWKILTGTLTATDTREYAEEETADDILPYDLFSLGLVAGEYTNQDLLELVSPSGPKLPYVYQNFKWTHCASLGYDIGNATAVKQKSAFTPLRAGEGE